MEKWQELNTVAHLTAALGAREGKGMFHANTANTTDDQMVTMNTSHAIMIKQIPSNEAIRNVLTQAREQ